MISAAGRYLGELSNPQRSRSKDAEPPPYYGDRPRWLVAPRKGLRRLGGQVLVVKLRGTRVTVRPMQRGDLDAMVRWRPFADPLYQPFDLPRRSLSDHIEWFDWRNRDPSRLLFTLLDENGAVIGSLTLREIQGRRSARLGITLGADFVSQGYGTEGMQVFMPHFYDTLGFQQMVLDVAATNLRAVRSYQRMGFRQVGQHYRPASHPSYRILREEPRYRHLRQYFRRQGVLYQVLFYDMVLTRQEWRARIQGENTP